MFYFVLCCLGMLLLIAFPSVAHTGAEIGFELFIDALLPFMLPYLILCNWFITLTLQHSFNQKQILVVTYFLSALGGYPIGAILLTKLVVFNKISRRQAAFLLPIMHHPSPIFLLGYVAHEIVHSTSFVLTFIIISHGITVSLLIFYLFKISPSSQLTTFIPTTHYPFSQSIKDTIHTLTIISATVIFFCTIFSVTVHLFHLLKVEYAFLDVLIANSLEITNGLKIAKYYFQQDSLILFTAFILSLQSFSIHLQIWVIAKSQQLSFKPYISLRLVITAIITIVFIIK